MVGIDPETNWIPNSGVGPIRIHHGLSNTILAAVRVTGSVECMFGQTWNLDAFIKQMNRRN